MDFGSDSATDGSDIDLPNEYWKLSHTSSQWRDIMITMSPGVALESSNILISVVVSHLLYMFIRSLFLAALGIQTCIYYIPKLSRHRAQDRKSSYSWYDTHDKSFQLTLQVNFVTKNRVNDAITSNSNPPHQEFPSQPGITTTNALLQHDVFPIVRFPHLLDAIQKFRKFTTWIR